MHALLLAHRSIGGLDAIILPDAIYLAPQVNDLLPWCSQKLSAGVAIVTSVGRCLLTFVVSLIPLQSSEAPEPFLRWIFECVK